MDADEAVARCALNASSKEAWAARYVSKLTRLSRSNFYVSFLFLPKAKRNAIFAVYAFCRVVDDSVDEAGNFEQKAKGLERWKRCLEDAYTGRATHPVMIPLVQATQKFDIPKEYFLKLIEGVEMDLARNRYETFEDLRAYCYRVASVVGLVCIRVFGYKDPRILLYAENLGIALQGTNILRDVGKDARMGRIYLPLEDLRRFGVAEAEILEGRATDRFRALMKFECERVESFYRKAEEFWVPSEMRTLFPAVIIKTIYQCLLGKIRAYDYDVYKKDIALSSMRKFWIALRIYFLSRFPPLCKGGLGGVEGGGTSTSPCPSLQRRGESSSMEQ